MAAEDLRRAIVNTRNAIRAHRDAKGDDRCWLDDYLVWECIKGSFQSPLQPPLFEQGMDMCRAFYKLRNSSKADVPPPEAIHDKTQWDADLNDMDDVQLTEELALLQSAIRAHRDAGGKPLTIEDDRALYAVLPEKLPADFRLPPEQDFLGEAKAPHAGCPSFWRSHEGCKTKRHDLHKWGPCRGDET